MLTLRALLVSLALSPLAVFAAAPPATKVLADAEARARSEHKNVMLIFHASWCGWCHRLDNALKNSQIAALMDRAYVIASVDIEEDPSKPDKKALENPGGLELMRQYFNFEGKPGVPDYIFFDPEGKVLGVSGDIGYPATSKEIAEFMALVGKSTPALSDSDRAEIESYFRRVAATLNIH